MASNQSGGWEFCDLQWHEDIAIAVAIPDFELSTAKARQVLPKQVSMHDAIFNASHLALLSHGISTGNVNWLRAGLQDRLHQPYRESLIIGMAEVQTAAIAAGAYGMVISGAGPTLLSLAPVGTIEIVAQAMQQAWQSIGVTAITKCLAIAKDGTTVTSR
jgi:homoserine kinase